MQFKYLIVFTLHLQYLPVQAKGLIESRSILGQE